MQRWRGNSNEKEIPLNASAIKILTKESNHDYQKCCKEPSGSDLIDLEKTSLIELHSGTKSSSSCCSPSPPILNFLRD